ncbi:hypothetical protein [Bradyrhizobium sp. CCGB20]|uniref:hypothetical protein n=1 Tax=Bradyrhizobium sp. CCGB20 TaxID=2949633 RepID=UPI0020B2345B|nr:hypothetical protein [Bradyrhizobium sp. CCGB20]MCP3401204.1 hypothetical protein [Bradyrhizobium sp. CCGB20]
MKEMLAHLAMLREQIAECERLHDSATSEIRRDLFARLLTRYRAIATELERAIAKLPPPSTFLGRKTREPFPKQEPFPKEGQE